MRRAGVIVALGALLGLFGGVVTASPALARGPKWQYLAFPRSFTIPAEFCGFEVRGTQLVDKVFKKVLKSADGSVTYLYTGAARIRFTNPATGKSVTENTSGPVKEIDFADGSFTLREKGHQPNVFFPADAARFGLPVVAVTAGALTGKVAPDGTLTSLSLHGHVLVDVCAALS
jgi:hypothetical protein